MAEKPGGSLPTRNHRIESPISAYMNYLANNLAPPSQQAEKPNGSTSNPLSGCHRASTMAEKPGGSLPPWNYLIESPISAYMNYLANNLAPPSHQAEKPNGSIPMRDCPNRDSSTELFLGFNNNPENEFPSPIQPNLGMESAISSERSREMLLLAQVMLINAQPPQRYKENEDKEKREAELIGNHVSAQPSTQRNNDYVEEVGIEDKVQKCNNQERTSPERLESVGEMTLQEFLARPGVVGESPPGKKKDAPVFGINPIAFTNKNVSQIRLATSTTMDRTHDIFWEQFLTERSGRSDDSNSDEGNEDKEKRNAEVIGNRVSTGPSRPGKKNCVEKLEDQRVKVYRLNCDGRWDDQGIGYITIDYWERSEEPGICVIDEDNETLLLHRISSDDIYRRQEDTIISWKDSVCSTELALSFQETAGCLYIWDRICSVQRNLHSGALNNETFHSVDSVLRGLPAVELSTLPLILKTVVESGIADPMRLTELILNDQDFFRKLMDLFRICEDLENIDALHMIFKIVRGIILLNSQQIFENIFRDELIMDIIGTLEYDPEVPNVQHHRKFVKEVEAIPTKDPLVLSKIHQTFRVAYLKDVILPRLLDEATIRNLNSIILPNIAFDDNTLLQSLFAKLRLPTTSAGSKKKLLDNWIRQQSIFNFWSSESDSGESDSDEIKAQSSGTLNEEKCQINCQVPEIGMVFSTEDEAYEFYKKYAGFIGFTVRKGKVQRLSDGKVRKKYFFCSRQGFRLKKQAKKMTKYRRKETRIGCEAKIQFTVKKGEWVVSNLNLEHNHEHVIPSQNCIIRSQYLDAHAIIDSVNEDEMTKEAADAKNVGFQSINCNNFLHHKKMNTFHPGDVQSFIKYLNHFQVKDPSFFYTVGVDAENRIKNFFWRDGRSKIDYDYFGDVLILDTTFRMDVYDMICALFVGVNHHRQYVLLGCAFLLDETTESFIWLFETLMRAMGGRQPKTIFTDEHQAMASAIGRILPKTQHRLCIWRICQNATKYLSKIYCQPGFQSNFNKCIFDCQSEKEFESMWLSLLEQYNLHDNQWLQSLYVSREKWSHSFSKKTFSANIESIRSGKGMNDVFHNLTNETMILTEFALQYEKEAERRRREELYEDFHTSKSLINLNSHLMEKQAVNIYTRAVFELFQEELCESWALEMEEIASVGTIATYKLREKDHRNESTVGFSFSDRTITCSCQKFDSTGILCLHALKVLNARNIFEIPAQYILKRWTKDAKDGVVDDCGEELIDEIKRPSSLDISKLTHKALTLITKCGTIKDTRAIAEHYLNRALEKVEEHLKTITVEDLEVDNEDDASVTNHFTCSETQKLVLNSSCVDLGEISRSRMRSQMKNKCEQKARDIKRKSCDDASTHHQPPVKVARGIDQESGGELGYSNCVGRNPLKHANIYQQTETRSASTFHHVDMQLSAPSNKPISRHNS